MRRHSEFWEQYQSVVEENHISPNAVKWYINWAKDFSKTVSGKPLDKCSKKEVQTYLDLLGHQDKYQEWQIKQADDALRILFGSHLGHSWAIPWPVFLKNRPVPSGSSSKKRDRSVDTPSFKDIPDIKSVEGKFPDLLYRVKTDIRTRHYAYRTERTYIEWICRYIIFQDLQHPEELGSRDVKSYLEYLATVRQVAASTQRQALNAIVFLYDKVLKKPFGDMGGYEKSRRSRRLPVVLTKTEVRWGLRGRP